MASKDLAVSSTKAPAPPIVWKHVKSGQFEIKKIKNGHIEQTGKLGTSPSSYYETEVDGVRVRFWEGDGNAALKGQVQAFTDGTGVAAAERIQRAMEKLGIAIERASDLDSEARYLLQVASSKSIAGRKKASAFFSSHPNPTQADVEAFRKLVSDILGVPDVTKLANYNYMGVKQDFGNGLSRSYRPELAEDPDFKKFTKEYRLHHDTLFGGTQLPDAIELMLNSGGSMISTTDKIRRGVGPSGGGSASSDLRTGGADYVYTRIKSKANAYGRGGIVWKSENIARTDAISYAGDKFGETSSQAKIDSWRKYTVDEWRAAARVGSNETIFKRSLSLFENLDVFVARTAAERTKIIDVIRKHGITVWPDGRAVEDVVVIAR